MENLKISKEKFMKVKDVIIFILLFLWMIMPILQSFKITYEFLQKTNIYFVLMKTISVVGISTATFIIYDKFKNSDNKKQLFKDVLPIFVFIIYMLWTLNSCFKANLPEQAFNGNWYRKEGYFMYINYAGFFFCSMLLENKKLRKILLNTLITSALCLVIICIVFNGGEKLENILVKYKTDRSVFKQLNHYGYYLMMALICCLGLFITEKNIIKKVVYIFIFGFIGYASIYNDTFGCYLANVGTLILYAIYAIVKKKDRILIFTAIMVFVLCSAITYKDGRHLVYENIIQLAQDLKIIEAKASNKKFQEIKGEELDVDVEFEKVGTNRMELWKNGFKFILKKPIIGYGPDNLRHQYLMVGIEQDRAHSLPIYLGCVSGIPGMIIYFIAVGIIAIRGVVKLFKKNGEGTKIFILLVISYLISSLFGNSMYYTSPYFFIFLGSLMHFNLVKLEE